MSLPIFLACIAAFVVGAVVPSGKELRARLGLGAVAFVSVWFTIALWPTGAKPTGAAPEESSWLLSLLIGLPVIGGAFVLFLPRQGLRTLRYVTYGIMAATAIASLKLLTVPMTTGWHFVQIKEWIPALGIRYHVAVDGISLWLVILTTFVTPLAMFASFGSIKTRLKELCFCFLLLEGTMIGAFVSLDLFLFYVFWEAVLVPMYIMIGIWGGQDKIKAAIKFFLYTMAGSVLMLAAMIYLVWTHQKLTGQFSFDLLNLMRVVLPTAPATLCFWAFSIAFFIKVPMWPVHTWLPDAHVQAPTGGSVVLASVMLKLGTYAYMRFSMTLFPERAASYAANLAGIAILGGIIYAALVAWKQDDVKRLVAYSSVAHLGYIMLGLFGATPGGMQGAVLQMVNHGVSTGALFLLVGVIYDRRHTRMVDQFGGLAKVMPVYATLFLIVTFASVGVPGTNGFVGEFMVIMGTYVSDRLYMFKGVHTIGASLGVILAAVYMLSVTKKMFFGPITRSENRHLKDLSTRETLALAPFIAFIFVIGFFPNLFLDPMKPSVTALFQHFRDISEQQKSVGHDRDAKLLPPMVFSPDLLKGALDLDAPRPTTDGPAKVADNSPTLGSPTLGSPTLGSPTLGQAGGAPPAAMAPGANLPAARPGAPPPGAPPGTPPRPPVPADRRTP